MKGNGVNMLCEICKHNYATTIVSKTVNGQTTSTHMCAECALKTGYSNLFGDFTLNHIMSSMDKRDSFPQKKCSKCGATFEEILSYGKIGCSNCYNTFNKELIPTIQKIHGNALHVGKKPKTRIVVKKNNNTLEELQEKLNKAIENQEFETAAVLRDEIKKIRESQ